MPTQGYLVFGLPVKWGHAIYFPKYKEQEKVFLLIDFLTVIQWVNIACSYFLKGNNPTQDFLITLCKWFQLKKKKLETHTKFAICIKLLFLRAMGLRKLKVQ